MTTSESRPAEGPASTTTERVTPSTDTAPLTRADRAHLISVAKGRKQLAKAQLEAAAARAMADFEASMAAMYDPQMLELDHLVTEAEELIDRFNKQIAEKCAERGIPANFAPSARFGWAPRGENWDPKRRAELRKVAATEVAAKVREGRLVIEEASMAAIEALIVDGLSSDAAREWLTRIPTADALVGNLDLRAIESRVQQGGATP